MRSIVYNQDCLEAMRQMPDKAFDLAIVDPPYGLGHRWIRPGENCHAAAAMAGSQWDNFAPSDEYFTQLVRVTKNQIIWGGNHFNLAPTRGIIIWDKPTMRIPTMADGELAWTSFDRPLKIVSVSNSVVERIHPTQKPVALYRWLLTNYAKPGDTILDTHLGSGSSRIAAYDLGFDFTGYELDKDYFEAQEKRFADHIAQAKLFDAPVLETVEQNNLF